MRNCVFTMRQDTSGELVLLLNFDVIFSTDNSDFLKEHLNNRIS